MFRRKKQSHLSTCPLTKRYLTRHINNHRWTSLSQDHVDKLSPVVISTNEQERSRIVLQSYSVWSKKINRIGKEKRHLEPIEDRLFFSSYITCAERINSSVQDMIRLFDRVCPLWRTDLSWSTFSSDAVEWRDPNNVGHVEYRCPTTSRSCHNEREELVGSRHSSNWTDSIDYRRLLQYRLGYEESRQSLSKTLSYAIDQSMCVSFIVQNKPT